MASKKKTDDHEKQLKFNLRPILEKRNWKIQNFSDEVGLSYRSAYGIVTNRYRRVDLDTLAKMSKALNVEVGELFVWE